MQQGETREHFFIEQYAEMTRKEDGAAKNAFRDGHECYNGATSETGTWVVGNVTPLLRILVL